MGEQGRRGLNRALTYIGSGELASVGAAMKHHHFSQHIVARPNRERRKDMMVCLSWRVGGGAEDTSHTHMRPVHKKPALEVRQGRCEWTQENRGQ